MKDDKDDNLLLFEKELTTSVIKILRQRYAYAGEEWACVTAKEIYNEVLKVYNRIGQINKRDCFLDILEKYDEKIKLAYSLKEEIKKETDVFMIEKIMEVSSIMKEKEIEDDVIRQWIKELIKDYTMSLNSSYKLIDSFAKDTIDDLENKKNIINN